MTPICLMKLYSIIEVDILFSNFLKVPKILHDRYQLFKDSVQNNFWKVGLHCIQTIVSIKNLKSE